MLNSITLTGRIVRLEPLSEKHIADLAIAGANESIWQYMLYGMVTDEDKMRAWVLDMLKRQSSGRDMPFAVRHSRAMRVIGATRYLNIDEDARGLEIGGTWYTPEFQRAVVNTETKYLLLKYAFEELNYIRVQFKTDLNNLPSQRAIERLGAKKEGILRQHIIRPDGGYRDSVFYSIIDSEWERVKARLEEMMGR